MDTLRGNFGSSFGDDDERDYDPGPELGEDETGIEPPPASIGTDERRMQVRAYNHWASLLADRNFPSIEDLEPDALPDFGPHSVLLDFTAGIDDPVVQYLGTELASECGDGGPIEKLSDVPPRSLLSRITDHYMQILANQAPIGFEAEFVNQRGSTILYRGILLPFSSDDDTIDFIYGVINWKEMADQATTDELLLEIDQALGEKPDDTETRAPDPVTDWADGPAGEGYETPELPEPAAEEPAGTEVAGEANVDSEPDSVVDLPADTEVGDEDWGAEDDSGGLPKPSFGMDVDALLGDDEEDADDDWGDEDDSRFASLLGASPEPSGGYDPEEEAGAEETGDDWGAGTTGTDTAEAAPIPEPYEAEPAADETAEEATDEAGPVEEPEAVLPHPVEDRADDDFDDGDTVVGEQREEADEPLDLYDCLADARELAQAARSSEDRSRAALYAAVGRAYDVSLAAQDEPEHFEELVTDSGLTVQDRAPMTPVVKLVFGADYDKTRLTEYAAVLSHAHRIGVERGELAGFLGEAEGGLKGVVKAERRLRREESGKPVEPEGTVRAKLAKTLRKLDAIAFEDISGEGAEFALVMIRRTETGEVELLGEVPEDIALIERAGRKLIG